MKITDASTQTIKKPIKESLLTGLVLSVCALVLWFLLGKSTRPLGFMFLAAAIVLTLVNYLLFLAVRKGRKGVKIAVRCVVIVLNAVFLLSATVYVIAPTLLFYPNSDAASYKALQSNAEAEELNISSDGQPLSGWMLHNTQGKAPLVLYFGGNGENASRRMLNIIKKNYGPVFNGYNFVMLDYPGYGKSDGSPSEESLKRMGLQAYDALAKRADVDAHKIVIFGYSLGTGVANYVAFERDAAGLILMAPYADGYDLYNSMMDIFHGPLRLLVAYKMESVQFAKEISVKPLILTSKDDEAVPYDSSLRLSRVYPAGCNLESYTGLKHNDYWGSDAVHKQITEYLGEVMQHAR